MIKSLKRNDIRYTPFVANKSWNSQNQRFEDLISWQSGSESGSLFLTFFDYGDGTQMSSVSSAFSSAIAYQQQDADLKLTKPFLRTVSLMRVTFRAVNSSLFVSAYLRSSPKSSFNC